MQPTSSSSSPPTSTPSAKRACDACHMRKVKCLGDGSPSCKNCLSAGLTCTYNAVPQRKGPKGSRAKVISMLRQSQRQQADLPRDAPLDREASDAPGVSESYTREDGLLSTDIMLACVDYFFAHLYPTQPILHRLKLGQKIAVMETDAEAYCVVLSLCAYMLIQPNIGPSVAALERLTELSAPATPQHLGTLLLHEVLRMRKSVDYSDAPTFWSVITSFFLFGSLFCLRRHNAAWFHLREATTLAHLTGMHEEAGYALVGDVIESTRRRRLYWLLFVTERAYALQHHKPLTLHASINLPTLEDDPSETTELTGFLHLVALYRPFDDTFLGLWNKTRNSGAGVGAGDITAWLAKLQSQLADALPVYLQATETQAADLRCSREWLRTMVWQLGLADGALSSDPADGAMSLRFPIDVSRDLATATSRFSIQAMEVHGIGYIEKLFDVACTLTDVMACVPNASRSPLASVNATPASSFEIGPRDYLAQLVKLIGSLRGGQQRYMAPLLEKLRDAGIPSPADASPSYGLQHPISPLTPFEHPRQVHRNDQQRRLQLRYQERPHISGDVETGLHTRPLPGHAAAGLVPTGTQSDSIASSAASTHFDSTRYVPFAEPNVDFGLETSRPPVVRGLGSVPDSVVAYGTLVHPPPPAPPLSPATASSQESHHIPFSNAGRSDGFGTGIGDGG